MMRELKGIGISPGLASGAAILYGARMPKLTAKHKIDRSNASDEHQRLHAAIATSIQDLHRIRQTVQEGIGPSEAGIFGFHIALLQDQDFIRRVKDRIDAELVSAETALWNEIERIYGLFSKLDDEYLRERASDFKDIGLHLLRNLTGEDDRCPGSLPPGSVVVTSELFPSDTAHLDRKNVAAIICERGGENTHAAILARSMGIPFVTGVNDATRHIADGMLVLVNGSNGVVTVLPNSRQRLSFEKKKEKYTRETLDAELEQAKQCATADGVEISLYANIGGLHEASSVLAHNLKGVGLLRTEHLFLDVDRPPTAESHQDTYAEMIRSIAGLPLTIRTLDLGGDKYPRFLGLNAKAPNPEMGMRGLRYSLIERDFFDEQVKAILRVSPNSQVRVLLPMVIDANDFLLAKQRIAELAGYLSISSLPKIGAMIETPSAIFQSDNIAAEADFLSIGTNDLAQFTLAADRQSSAMSDSYFALHPAVLKAIQVVLDAASAHDREVCICGEVAGDPASACILVGLGIRNLSMSPVRASRVRLAIRRHHSQELKQAAEEASSARSVDDVKQLLHGLL